MKTYTPTSELVFIIGTGRCGTTMTHEVLACHPDTGFVSNVDANVPALNLTGRFNSRLLSLMPRAVLQRDHRHSTLVKMRARFGPAEPYQLLNHHVSPMVSESTRDLTADDATPWLRNRLTQFFERRMSAQGKPVFLCKMSGWPRARLLHEIFPRARFVHVVRDGRAVAESMIRRPWWTGFMGPSRWQYGPLPEHLECAWKRSGRSYVALAGIQWMLLIDAFDEARAELPADQWLEIRYEQLIASPRCEFAKVLEFTGMHWNDQFERAFARYEFAPERMNSYRSGLTPAQLRLLDEIMGDHLRRKGYKS